MPGGPSGRLASRMRRVRKGRAARRDIPELWSDRRVTAANSCDNRLLRSYLVQTRQLPQAPEAGSVRQPVIDVRVPNPNGDDADTARQHHRRYPGASPAPVAYRDAYCKMETLDLEDDDLIRCLNSVR